MLAIGHCILHYVEDLTTSVLCLGDRDTREAQMWRDRERWPHVPEDDDFTSLGFLVWSHQNGCLCLNTWLSVGKESAVTSMSHHALTSEAVCTPLCLGVLFFFFLNLVKPTQSSLQTKHGCTMPLSPGKHVSCESCPKEHAESCVLPLPCFLSSLPPLEAHVVGNS